MRTTFLTALVAGVVFVAGCGGGGGSNVRPGPGGGQVAGPTCPAGQTGTPPNCVAPPPEPQPLQIRYGTASTVPAADLIDYLRDMASGGPWGPPGYTWERPPKLTLWIRRPTVRVESSAHPELHRLTARAVDIINDWLPVNRKMRMGEPTALHTDNSGDVPDGVIHVSFRGKERGTGDALYHEIRDDRDPHDVPRMSSVVVRVGPNDRPDTHQTYGLLVHELIHAMGLPGHVSEYRHPTTLMPDEGPGLPNELGLPGLPYIDGEALMAAYTIFNSGQYGDAINYRSLGPWFRTKPAIMGELETRSALGNNVWFGFGVEYHPRGTRAWDDGPTLPYTTLADSPLTGTATWTGQMVGFTDAGMAVEGDTGITVDIARLDGTAAFTDIEARNGAPWGPDLATGIRVRGNYIESTQAGPWVGFDAQFRGSGHEAATGTFRWERTDTGNLTAAFGTTRDEP